MKIQRRLFLSGWRLAALDACSVYSGTQAYAQDRGQETGNGGHFCSKSGEKPVPCDLYFEVKNFELDYREDQKFDSKRLSQAVQRELAWIYKTILTRSDGTVVQNFH